MNKTDYAALIFTLSQANSKFKNNADYSQELQNACVYINDYMQHSPNKAQTAFEIENCCLEYDRSINIKKNVDRIDSRLTGCLAAIKDIKDLQKVPERYIREYLQFQPHNINAETTYTKEAFNCLKYLGVEKNANYTNEAGYNFYEKRQDIIKQAKQAYIKEKQQTFEKILIQQKEVKKDRGLER